MIWRSSIGVAAQRLIQVGAPTDVAEVRRQGLDLAAQLGFGEQPAAQLALALTEAGSNIVKHAREGLVLLRPLSGSPETGIEVLAMDKGPGMADVRRSMQDGYSTAGTPGTGLGALMRLTRSLEIFSRPGRGTLLRFEMPGHRDAPVRRAPIEIGAVCIPKPGEIACGDAWGALDDGRRTVLLVVDGLGHGPAAAAAAHAALDALRRSRPSASAAEALNTVHRGLKGTRGAAGAVAVVDLPQSRGCYCGIGNISCTLAVPPERRQLFSHHGILGHLTRSMHELEFAFPPGATLIAHSDGVNTHWRLDDYAGLERHHPALIAGMLYRDHCRGRDDATCVVLRRSLETPP